MKKKFNLSDLVIVTLKCKNCSREFAINHKIAKSYAKQELSIYCPYESQRVAITGKQLKKLV